MTFQQLEYLLQVEKTGSISKAAENLNVTRSSISLSVRSLEEELGYPVFLRTPTGLIPSALGEQVLDHARLICSTQKQIKALNNESIRHIRIGSVDYPPVAQALVRLLKEHSHRTDITFTIHNNYSEPLKRLAAGELDILLTCSYPAPGKKIPEGIAKKELCTVPVVLLLGPGHRLYHKTPLVPADFKKESILETPGRALSRITTLRQVIPFDPEHSISVQHPNLREHLLTEGVCFSLRRMPEQNYLDQHHLRCIQLEDVHQVVCCYTNTTRKPAPEIKQFMQLLEEELNNYHPPVIREYIGKASSEA